MSESKQWIPSILTGWQYVRVTSNICFQSGKLSESFMFSKVLVR